jgi:hypothetical protein
MEFEKKSEIQSYLFQGKKNTSTNFESFIKHLLNQALLQHLESLTE